MQPRRPEEVNGNSGSTYLGYPWLILNIRNANVSDLHVTYVY